MKKVVRAFLMTLTVIFLCVSLSGCSMIDDLRASQAFWNEDGSFTYNGETFIPVPDNEILSPDFGEEEDLVFVTAPDVPVLLSGILGEYGCRNTDGAFIMINDTDSYLSTIYCRSDLYDYVTDTVANGFAPIGYMYSYDILTDPEYDEWASGNYKFTALEAQVLDTVLQNGVPVSNGDDILMSTYYTYIYAYSEDTYFSEHICDIYLLDGVYYVVEYDETDAFIYTVRQVPDGYSETFEVIMQKAIEETDSWALMDSYYEW